MWPLPERWLVAWTMLAATWWGVALVLVQRRRRREETCAARVDAEPVALAEKTLPHPSPSSPVRISIFKPVPALHGRPVELFARPIETFVRQLDGTSELLLGLEKQDEPAWKIQLASWQTVYPRAVIRAVYRSRPTDLVSPKVSWHRVLSVHARGAWWLWSDADIAVPEGFVAAISRQLVEGDVSLVTSPYVIREPRIAPMWLETLFVNVEFYPGVLACERVGALRFGFGAALLFTADSFHERVGWDRIRRMAEDYVMGNRLTPVALSAATVETFAAETRWKDAVLHYFRWHKTVRWNRPFGFAGQILVLPLLGWLVAGHGVGIAATLLVEAVAATLLCRAVGCRLAPRHGLVLPLWSLLRVVVWIGCWLPLPVVFQSQQQRWSSLWRTRAGVESSP